MRQYKGKGNNRSTAVYNSLWQVGKMKTSLTWSVAGYILAVVMPQNLTAIKA